MADYFIFLKNFYNCHAITISREKNWLIKFNLVTNCNQSMLLFFFLKFHLTPSSIYLSATNIPDSEIRIRRGVQNRQGPQTQGTFGLMRETDIE